MYSFDLLQIETCLALYEVFYSASTKLIGSRMGGIIFSHVEDTQYWRTEDTDNFFYEMEEKKND